MTFRFLLLLPLLASVPRAQEPASFESAAAKVRDELERAVADLEASRARITAEKLPLSRRLSELERELIDARAEFEDATRTLDGVNLAVTNLTAEVKKREAERDYVANLLGEYARELEAGLHVAELQRYGAVLTEAKLAVENTALADRAVFEAQERLVAASIDRIEEALGGARFDGAAVGPDGTVEDGTFVLLGPAGIFRARSGAVGTAEQRLGSLEPARIAYADPADVDAALALVDGRGAVAPLDVTLGDAHKIAATEETLVEHVRKGGAVMVPILLLAGLALAVAVLKWISLATVRRPASKAVDALLDAVGAGDEARARDLARAMPGPVGRMLAAGVEHLREPRELIEEAMYERVLATRLKLQAFLPFLAVSASAAPLLGLLGTVTGIITTFKMITVFGSSDVKSLSGGISEALITTEYGLIVAIPSLLLHAFLSRKAKSVVDGMERTAIAFTNRVGAAPEPERAIPPAAPGGVPPDPALVREQVVAILGEILDPLIAENDVDPTLRRPAPAR